MEQNDLINPFQEKNELEMDSSPVQETVTSETSFIETTVEDETTVKTPSIEEETSMNAEAETNTEISIEPNAISDESHQEITHDEILSETIELEEVADVDYHSLTPTELISELLKLVSVENILAVKTKIGEIRAVFSTYLNEQKKTLHDAYIAEGGDPEKYIETPISIEFEFNKIFKIYKDKKAKITAEQEAEKKINLEKKKAILDRLKELIHSESTLKETYNEVKEFQEKWREIGNVPQEAVNDLWQSYNFLMDKFHDKVRINHELRNLDLKKNLEAKIALAEKAEELLIETSINKSFKLLQEYHTKWKEIGAVPQDKSDEIWERFKTISDKINSRRKEHYDTLNEEQKQNLLLKTALCEKAEEILSTGADSSKEWQDSTDVMNQLLEEWKTLGPAPKKLNDEIWFRFKASLNAFYNNKKEINQKNRDEQTNNYNLKLDIIRQAEALKDSTDWKKSSNDLIKLQAEWKKIGPVPRKFSDKIWKQFRAACDHFFNSKSEFFKNIDSIEADNLKLKEELIEQVRVFVFGENKEENLNAIKDFQRKWMEIGRVPIAEKNRLQFEFRKVIDSHFDKLNINQHEVENMHFKNRIDQIQDKREADHTLGKEIYGLQTKISKIQSDITLWDNNIGFLANSKNADLLKAEIEKKIQKAKQEIEQMIAKIKYLEKMRKGIS